MSKGRSFELSKGRLGTRRVGHYLMYLQCVAGLNELYFVHG